MFDKGSTAVLSTTESPFIVAVKKAGIYSFENGEWSLQYPITQNIYKLIHIEPYIFGIGDNGTILRYNPFRKKWTHTTFPTSQRLWDITGDETGLIITHAGSKLFLSKDFGSSWNVIKPFESLIHKPLIRSLFYQDGDVYMGTQINHQSGGLWKYSLITGQRTLVKQEAYSMISSIYIDQAGTLFIAKGNAHSGEGSIEMKSRFDLNWHSFQQPIAEKAFLDLFSVDDHLYATTSQDEYGYSRIYEINTKVNTLLPIETVQGHSFRGAGFKDELFICSPVESKWVFNRYKVSKFVH
ncbi:hypothetical protein LS684_09010 [Cytobacillus spongiae]|uniref:hypothetical protein n=1 Tax=Cytobacillus spongiae TaxID=2901381 RepID=UPI001F2A14B9|nr:hypothetical protein [Cytobacillus spongiae]UII57550.1 hypothetical protein LS684_09010 [Cytobacillus spongiae]